MACLRLSPPLHSTLLLATSSSTTSHPSLIPGQYQPLSLKVISRSSRYLHSWSIKIKVYTLLPLDTNYCMQGYFTPPWFPPSWPLMKLSNPASAVTHQGRRHEYHELGGGGEIMPSSDWVPQMIISHNYYTTYGDFILIKLLNKSKLGILCMHYDVKK